MSKYFSKTKFKITCLEYQDSLAIELYYDNDKISQQDFLVIESQLKNIFDSFINNQNFSIALSKYEKSILSENNNTSYTHDIYDSIVDMFDKQALKYSGNDALIEDNRRVTYKELLEKSNQFANYLLNNLGVTKGDAICVLTSPSESFIVTILGILKAGAYYVPIDHNYPNERVQYILNDCQTRLLVSDIKTKEDTANLNIEILTSDVMQKKGKGETILRRFEREEINVIIGTQILAKGHHFPKLTLVVIVDADFGFIGGDLRAAEKTFQLLTQVSGRSGRSKLLGKVLIQSTMADNPILKNIKKFDLNSFFLEEINTRKESGLPPFKKLCSVTLVSKNEKKLNDFCGKMKVNIEPSSEFEVLGPAPPFISYVRGKYRKRFIIRCSRNKNIQQFVSIWLKKLQIPFDLKISVDIDPYNFS